MIIDLLVTLEVKYFLFLACLHLQRLRRNLAILYKKKEIRLKRRNRKKAILLNIA